MIKNCCLLVLILSTLGVGSCNSQPPTVPPKPDSNSEQPRPNEPVDQIVNHPNKLNFPLLQVTIPKPKRIELNNGLIIYLLENHELPLIEITVRVKAGSIYDPSDKLGLASLTATLMRNGGAGSFAPAAFDEELESLGATLSVDADYEEMNFSLSILKEDAEKGLQLLYDIMRAPRFDEKRLAFEKTQLGEIFRRQNEKPQDIAFREFRKAIYPNHPYGNQVDGTPETVKGISRDDILQFYKRYIQPNNLFIGITGDFKTDEIMELINQKFGDWLKQKIVLPSISPLELKYKKTVWLVPKDITQTTIVVGHLGVKRITTDYFPILLMNAILGGSSVSRLYHKVREQEGLAYGVFSFLVMSRDLGMFVIETDTKNASVSKASHIILDEVRGMKADPVKDAELKHTKDAILSSFVFRFTNPQRIVDQYIYMEYLGLPGDYLETYRDNVMRVTKEDIQRVAKQYLQPDDFVFVFVGNEKEIKDQASEFGPLNIIPLRGKGEK